MNLKFDKEIPDILEYALLRAGRLVLHVQNERKAIVLDNVLWIDAKENELKKLMSRMEVRITSDQEAAAESVRDGPGSGSDGIRCRIVPESPRRHSGGRRHELQSRSPAARLSKLLEDRPAKGVLDVAEPPGHVRPVEDAMIVDQLDGHSQPASSKRGRR